MQMCDLVAQKENGKVMSSSFYWKINCKPQCMNWLGTDPTFQIIDIKRTHNFKICMVLILIGCARLFLLFKGCLHNFFSWVSNHGFLHWEQVQTWVLFSLLHAWLPRRNSLFVKPQFTVSAGQGYWSLSTLDKVASKCAPQSWFGGRIQIIPSHFGDQIQLWSELALKTLSNMLVLYVWVFRGRWSQLFHLQKILSRNFV